MIGKIIKRLFNKKVEILNNPKKQYINELSVYDDVYIYLHNKLYKAWVMMIYNNILTVCYQDSELLEEEFDVTNKLNCSYIKKENAILLLNDKELDEILNIEK